MSRLRRWRCKRSSITSISTYRVLCIYVSYIWYRSLYYCKLTFFSSPSPFPRPLISLPLPTDRKLTGLRAELRCRITQRYYLRYRYSFSDTKRRRGAENGFAEPVPPCATNIPSPPSPPDRSIDRMDITRRTMISSSNGLDELLSPYLTYESTWRR